MDVRFNDLNIKDYHFDESTSGRYHVYYVDDDNEDDFLEIVDADNKNDILVVLIFKSCEHTETYVFDKNLSDEQLSDEINKIL